jgi:hypothetical protein
MSSTIPPEDRPARADAQGDANGSTVALSPLGKQAAIYARRGWPIFPLKERGKEPKTAGGFKAATSDADQVVKWWTQWPDANIGFHPGPGRLVVLDLDGPAAFDDARKLGLLDVPTLAAKSGRAEGGQHLYFQLPAGVDRIGNKKLLGDHIDIRAHDGYIVVPPSVHPNGNRYEWIAKHPPAELPATVRDQLLGKSPPLTPIPPAREIAAQVGIKPSNRTTSLTMLSGRLIAKGHPTDEVVELCLGWNQRSCDPPLPDDKVVETVRSIAERDGRQKAVVPTTPEEIAKRRDAGTLGRPLADLLNDPALLIEPTEQVPLLAVKGGVTLLSGREKSGKSTLVGYICSRLSQGAPGDRTTILGAEVDAGVTVGWYAIDERLGDAVRRFGAMGAHPDRVWINDTPRTMDALLSALAFDLAARPDTKVIVLDTLSRALASSGVDTNDAGPVERVLGTLVDVLHTAGVAAVLLYHTGKAGHTYRGSTALGAVVDDIATLRRRSQPSDDEALDDADDADDDGRRTLILEGRYLRGRHQLVSDARSGFYDLYDPAFSGTARVLNALTRGAARSRNELAKWAGGRRQDTLSEIATLINRGQISEYADGALSLPTAPVPGSRGGSRVQEKPRSGTSSQSGSQGGSPLWEPAEPPPTGSQYGTPGGPESGTTPLAGLLTALRTLAGEDVPPHPDSARTLRLHISAASLGAIERHDLETLAADLEAGTDVRPAADRLAAALSR